MSEKNNKEEVIQIRVSRQQLEAVKHAAKNSNMSLSNYVRQYFSSDLQYQNILNATDKNDSLQHLTRADIYALRRDLSLVGSRLNELVILASKSRNVIGDIQRPLEETLELTIRALQNLTR